MRAQRNKEQGARNKQQRGVIVAEWWPWRRIICCLTSVVLVAVFLCLIAACGGGKAAPTPQPIIEGNALQIFVREGEKVGWFTDASQVQLSSEPAQYEEALAKAQSLGMQLYPTVPGTPSGEGRPGWYMTARGDFFDVKGGQSPAADTPRRPALAAAFVDRWGGLSYAWRFTD